MSKPKKPRLTPQQMEEERAADERDTDALRRFFGHLLAGTLKPSCSRLGSSQRKRKARKK